MLRHIVITLKAVKIMMNTGALSCEKIDFFSRGGLEDCIYYFIVHSDSCNT